MGKIYLGLLFVGICLAHYLRISVEATAYTTPDSHFYMRVADNVQEGKGLLVPVDYPFDEDTEEHFLAMWPAAYPLMIAGLSELTGSSELVASKIVNLIFLGLIFILLYRWVGEYAWFPTLYFASFGMMEVFSYTWTEGPFLFFVLYLCYVLSRGLNGKYDSLFFLKLSFALIGLFSLRYAGIIYFFFTTTFLLYMLAKREVKPSVHIFTALVLSSLFVIFYLIMNYQQTGYYSGGERFYDETDPGLFFMQMVQGVLNEFFIARNYYFTGYTDYLFLLLLCLQLLLFYIFFRERKCFQILFKSVSGPSLILCGAGLFYLPVLTLLSYFLWFDRFNYRILAPFSAPVLVGLLIALTYPENRLFFLKTYKWVVAFMILSLVINLPKGFILDQVIFLLAGH